MNNGIAKRGFGRVMMKKGGILSSPEILLQARRWSKKKLGKNATSKKINEGTAKQLKKITKEIK